MNRIISLGPGHAAGAAAPSTHSGWPAGRSCSTSRAAPAISAAISPPAGYRPIGVDFSAGMLARARTPRRSCAATRERLPLRDHVGRRRRVRIRLRNFVDVAAVFVECARVLRPVAASPRSTPPCPNGSCSGPATRCGSGARCRCSAGSSRATATPTATSRSRRPTSRRPARCSNGSHDAGLRGRSAAHDDRRVGAADHGDTVVTGAALTTAGLRAVTRDARRARRRGPAVARGASVRAGSPGCTTAPVS